MSTGTITTSRVTRALALAVAAAMLALPAAAFAAPAQVASYDVRTIIQPDGGRAMLAAVELAPETKLPAEVSVNVPKGAKIDWAGEILGGDLASDPTVQYTTKSGAEFDMLTFTLTKARRGQVELLYPAGATKNGDATKATLAYAPAQAAPRVSLSIEVPVDAKVGQVPADLKKQPTQGSSFYSKAFQHVAPGQKLEVAVDYTGGTLPQPSQPGPVQGQPGAAAPQTGGSSPISPLIAVLALGAILTGTFAVLTYMGKGNASAQMVEEDETPARVRRNDDDDTFFEDDELPAEPVKASPAKPAAAKNAASKKSTNAERAGTATVAKKPAAKPVTAKATTAKAAPKKGTGTTTPTGKTTARKSAKKGGASATGEA